MERLPYKSILFVCEANKCRSAMAEFLLKHMLQELGVEDQIQVRSGGIAIYARDGSLASQDVAILLKEDGIVVPDHFRSTDLNRHSDLIAEADLILTMTAQQIERLADFPEAQGKESYTLKKFAGESGDIDDPEGEGDDAYAKCKVEVERCLKKSIGRIRPQPIS